MNTPSTPLSVLVAGGGMYVTGKGAKNSKGTILPALFEARRAGKVGSIAIATTNQDSAQEVEALAAALGREMAVEPGVDVYPKNGTDHQAYLAAADDLEMDAAIVSVPDHLHAKVCCPLIERGKHCLVVKPLAGSVEDGRAMCEAARSSGVVAQVEFHKRLDESNLLLREKVRSGAIGQPLYGVIEYSQRKTVPEDVFRGWAGQSNIFQYLGVHYVDLLQWALGYTPVKVSCWGQKAHLAGLGVDTWDAMQTVVEWRGPDGVAFISTHITNWIDPNESSAMSDQKINVVGTKGRFQADQKHRGVQLVTDGQGVEDLNPYFTLGMFDEQAGGTVYSGYGIDSVIQYIDDVIAVRSGSVTPGDLEGCRPTFETCLKSTEVVDAARKSLEQGGIPVGI